MPSADAPAAADASPQALANAAFDRRLDPGSSAPLALALSGGGDSMALLGLAAAWAGEHGRPLLALTVDHGLNPDSRAWSAMAARAAKSVGAGWLGLEWRGAKPQTGLPAAARKARHALMADAARRAGARVLLTGHTLDDTLEGERMRAADAPSLGRLREWSPSPAWPEGRGLFLLRPLMGLRRETLREWLRDRGWSWVEDPANADLRFARSRARAALTASTAGDAEPDAADPRTRRPSNLHPGTTGLSVTADGRILLPRGGIDAPVLSAALLCAAGGVDPPRGVQLERLLDRLAGAAAVDATLAGARLVADAETVQIGRDAGERFRGGLQPIPLAPGESVVWDGRFEVATGSEGVSVQALGGVIARLSGADRSRLRPIPPWARGALPALVSPDQAVTLPMPLATGPAVAKPLAGWRAAAALGLIGREAQVGDPPHGAEDLLTLC